MGLDEVEQEKQKMKDPRDNIFITIFLGLGFMVVLAIFMLALGKCYGF